MLIERDGSSLKEQFLNKTKLGETSFTKYELNGKKSLEKSRLGVNLSGKQNATLFQSIDEVLTLPSTCAPANLASSCVKWGNITKLSLMKTNQSYLENFKGPKSSADSLPVMPKSVKSDNIVLPNSALSKHCSNVKQNVKSQSKTQNQSTIVVVIPNKFSSHTEKNLMNRRNKDKQNMVFINKEKHSHTSCGFRHQGNTSLPSAIPPKLKVTWNKHDEIITQPKWKRNKERKSARSFTTSSAFFPISGKSKLNASKENQNDMNLPPPLITSPSQVLKPHNKDLRRKVFTSHSTREEKKKLSCDKQLLRIPLNGNRLGDRLSLIHCYGCEYENIAFERQQEKEKEQALIKREIKRAEKIGKEKQKKDQRKKIYALNRLMTKLEQEKFQQFMSNLTDTEDAFI